MRHLSLRTTEGAVVITLRKLESLKTEHVSAEELLRMVEEELEAELQCQNTVKMNLTKLKNLRFIISEVGYWQKDKNTKAASFKKNNIKCHGWEMRVKYK